MNATTLKLRKLLSDLPLVAAVAPRRSPATLLLAAGAVLLLAAGLYAAYVVLNGWLSGQDRYLMAERTATLSAQAQTWQAAQPKLAAVDAASPPIQIRIPAIGVKRSIIELPVSRDPKTGYATRDVESLLRSGRQDLVGHWGGSAYPGQPGNAILVGHNYGYGRKGVFVRLGKLQLGDRIEVITEAGQTLGYEVVSVERVKWLKKDADELRQHGAFLSSGGPERLTLVTCGGAEVAPFPERIYVTAEPIEP